MRHSLCLPRCTTVRDGLQISYPALAFWRRPYRSCIPLWCFMTPARRASLRAINTIRRLRLLTSVVRGPVQPTSRPQRHHHHLLPPYNAGCKRHKASLQSVISPRFPNFLILLSLSSKPRYSSCSSNLPLFQRIKRSRHRPQAVKMQNTSRSCLALSLSSPYIYKSF